MSFLPFLTAAAVAYAPATVAVAPDNSAVSVSDFYGTVTKNPSRIRLTRPIVDGQGYEHCAPGARVRFQVVLTDPGQVQIDLDYTGLVQRFNTYAPEGAVLVDGVETLFTNPVPKNFPDPHPVASITLSLALLAGTHVIEVVFPYCASMDYRGARVPVGAVVQAAPARPSQIVAFLNDSIPHGFNSSGITKSWAYKLAAEKNWQMYNLANGGRQIVPADFTIAGQTGAQRTIANGGINNCFAGTTQAGIQSQAELGIVAYRAEAAASDKLHWINLFDCASPSLITAPADARTAISDAFTAKGGANDIVIAGGTANGLPAASGFTDLVHPDDDDVEAIVSSISAQVS